MRTVLGADKIVVLKDGMVFETGIPAELQAKGGIFAAMLKTQCL
jgi:ATP-binding cassette subfamily B protein